jgi:hypothetical protein
MRIWGENVATAILPLGLRSQPSARRANLIQPRGRLANRCVPSTVGMLCAAAPSMAVLTVVVMPKKDAARIISHGMEALLAALSPRKWEIRFIFRAELGAVGV